MHSAIIIVHVVSMVLSIGLMSIAVGLGLFGKLSAARVATVGFATSISGFITGLALLIDSVLSLQCATLTLYLVGVTLLYRYGFALGDPTRARLIRQS